MHASVGILSSLAYPQCGQVMHEVGSMAEGMSKSL